MKLDISQSHEYEENIRKLNNDRNRLAAADYLIVRLYDRNKDDLEISGINIVYCADGDVGDWVSFQNHTARLAICSEKDPIWANAIIIEKLINGFVVIQQSGEVAWTLLANQLKNPKENSSNFYLGANPGEMVTERILQRRKNQRLGRYISVGKSLPYFLIEMQVE